MSLRKTNPKKPEHPSARAATVFIAGDFCPMGLAGEKILAGKSMEMAPCLAEAMRGAGISVINLEAPLTLSEAAITKSGPNLKAHPGTAAFLPEHGFNVAALANNHIGDFGPGPVMETISALENAGIKTVGAGADIADARKPLFLDAGGLKIALINRAENEFGSAAKNKAGAAALDPLEDVGLVRRVSQTADFTIVFAHAGAETNPFPTPLTVKLFHAFADAGASAVIGAHTHCPQGFEVRNGTPIIYSLGNFMFGWDRKTPYNAEDFWWTGYGVKLEFARGKTPEIEIVPFHSGPDGARLRLLAAGEREGFVKYLEAVSAPIADENEMNALYEAWCAMNGPAWLSRLLLAKWPLESEQDYRNMMIVRNSFTCEAHRELNTVFLRMIEEKRVEPAAALIPRVKELQRASFVKP